MPPSNSFQKDFVPMSIYDDKISPLSRIQLSDLIQKLDSYIDGTAIENIDKTNTIHWLTYALHRSVKTIDHPNIQHVSQIIYKLAKKDPDAFISILSQTIEEGEFKGQNTVFVWIHELYSATFDTKNYPTIVAINFIFSYLLDNANEELAQALIKNIEEGPERGKNALLIIAQALLQAASESYNQPSTLLIAELLAKCIKQSPKTLGLALMQEFSQGSFKGKSTLYMLVRALKDPSKDNAPVINIICNILSDIIQIHSSNDLAKSLFKVTEVGPYRGLHYLHIILTSLVSAAYIDNNDKVIMQITSVLQRLYEAVPEAMSLALAENITTGEHINENGVMMLVHALIAAFDHKLEATPIVSLLSRLIDTDSNLMAAAFTHQVEANVKYKNVSPLQLLVNKLNKHDDKGQIFQIDHFKALIYKLAYSQYAVPMFSTLPLTARSTLLAELATNNHCLVEKVSGALNEKNFKELGPGAGSDEIDVNLRDCMLYIRNQQFFKSEKPASLKGIEENLSAKP